MNACCGCCYLVLPKTGAQVNKWANKLTQTPSTFFLTIHLVAVACFPKGLFTHYTVANLFALQFVTCVPVKCSCFQMFLTLFHLVYTYYITKKNLWSGLISALGNILASQITSLLTLCLSLSNTHHSQIALHKLTSFAFTSKIWNSRNWSNYTWVSCKWDPETYTWGIGWVGLPLAFEELYLSFLNWSQNSSVQLFSRIKIWIWDGQGA